jgi:hypothetical protein
MAPPAYRRGHVPNSVSEQRVGDARAAYHAAMSSKWTAILILASAQFVMVLDSSVMNVSISQIVADLDTTIGGVQLAITAYTLVMAAFMLVGAKLGDIWGRDRAFATRARTERSPTGSSVGSPPPRSPLARSSVASSPRTSRGATSSSARSSSSSSSSWPGDS